MAILVDAPRWPAHGTVWAHLVSDTSLAELHRFAAGIRLSRRGFDLDHYDLSPARHAEAVAAGAQQVTGGELVRRLRASGLRVIGADRPGRRRLLAQWRGLVPGAEDAGLELLQRWTAPGRSYHGVAHLQSVLEQLAALDEAGEQVGRAVLVAAWFHDAVHDGRSPADEHASAALADTLLGAARSPPTEVAEVARLVRLTIEHDPEDGDVAGRTLCDADLAILGGTPEAYVHYTEQVRAEYAALPEADFRAGRATVLRRFLDRPTIYRTTTGRQRWEEPARGNLSAELARLTR